MLRSFAPVVLLCLVSLSASAQTLTAVFDRLLLRSPAAQQAHWGVQVVDVVTGRVVFQRDANKLFTPASNTKLFTTALALTRLGASYRFNTRVLANEVRNGTIDGNLTIEGGGDPDFSARVFPYNPDAETNGDSLAAIDQLADQIVTRGVKRIAGDIVGDDRRYPWEPFAEGWAWDDAVWDYGAAVSALTLNDSTFLLRVLPAQTGEPPLIELKPSYELFTIHNLAATVATGESKIEVDRQPLAHELTITGRIALGSKPKEERLAVTDPAEYAAAALRQALITRGVAIDGEARALHRAVNEADPPASGTELAKRESQPLSDVIKVVNKISQNLHAEMLLREVSRARKGSGSLKDGLEEMKVFLNEAKVPSDAYEFHDGSGLSRLNLITPNAAVTLLRYMYAGNEREAWVQSLPIGGIDGSLRNRYGKDVRGHFVHAKTGSLSHVSALSGYLLPENGRRYAFSILVNGYRGPTSEMRKVMDEFLLAILKSGK